MSKIINEILNSIKRLFGWNRIEVVKENTTEKVLPRNNIIKGSKKFSSIVPKNRRAFIPFGKRVPKS